MTQHWQTTFQVRVNAYIAEHSLTQSQLAARLKTHQSTVSRWLAGDGTVDSHNLVQLARLMNVSCDYLVGLTDDPQPSNAKSAADRAHVVRALEHVNVVSEELRLALLPATSETPAAAGAPPEPQPEEPKPSYPSSLRKRPSSRGSRKKQQNENH